MSNRLLLYLSKINFFGKGYCVCDEVHAHYTHVWSKLLGVPIGVYQPCPDLKRTLVAMSERTGLSISQVTDEVLYTGLVEMQEMDELEE